MGTILRHIEMAFSLKNSLFCLSIIIGCYSSQVLCNPDIVLVIDESDSQNDFDYKRAVNVLRDIVHKVYNTLGEGSRFALIQAGGPGSRTLFSFGTYNKDQTLKVLNEMKATRTLAVRRRDFGYGGINLTGVMNKTRSLFTTSPANSAKYTVIVTHGKLTTTARSGVGKIIVIGNFQYGNPGAGHFRNDDNLRALASSPDLYFPIERVEATRDANDQIIGKGPDRAKLYQALGA